MIKMSIQSFIEEIKGEIMCYEELGEIKAIEWEKNFLSIVKKNKVSILKDVNKKEVSIKDESVLFEYVDNYAIAVELNEEDKYWANF